MILSDISVTRPVFASVLSLLLIAFGLVAFDRLPRRHPRHQQRSHKLAAPHRLVQPGILAQHLEEGARRTP